MLYRVNLLKFQKISNLEYRCPGVERDSIKSINPSKVNLSDFNFNDIDSLTGVRAVDFFAKFTYANMSQQNPINLSTSDGALFFKTEKDLGQFIGLKFLKEENIIIDCPIELNEKIAKLVHKFELDIPVNNNNVISWEVTPFEVVNEWDNEEFVLNLLSGKYPNYGDIFSLANKKILSSKKEIDLYIDKEEVSGLIPREIIFSDMFKECILSNYSNVLIHNRLYLADFIKETYIFFSKYDDEPKDSHNYNLKSFTNEKFLNIEKNNLFPQVVAHTKWFWDNLFGKIDKCEEFIEWYLQNTKSKSFTSFMEFLVNFDADFFKDKKIQEAVRKAYKILSRDYGSNSLSKYIPSEYFDDKEVCKEFIRQELLAGINQVNQIMTTKIQSHFKDDLPFYYELIDFINDNFNSRDAKILAKSFVLRLNDAVTYETKRKVDYFKLQLLVSKIEINNFSYHNYLSNIYEGFLYNDKGLMEFIINKVPPENVVSLPKKFIFSIEDKDYLRKVISSDNSLLSGKNVPHEIMYDIENILATGSHSHNIRFTKKELKNIVKDRDVAYKLVKSNPFILSFLPQEYKSDREIALLAVNSKPSVLNDCDNSILLDKDFCLSLIKVSNEFVKRIPAFHFYDSTFMINLFSKIDSGEISMNIFKVLPNEIFQCLSAFKVEKGGYKDFAESFFSKQILSKELKVETRTPTVKRIKI